MKWNTKDLEQWLFFESELIQHALDGVKSIWLVREVSAYVLGDVVEELVKNRFLKKELMIGVGTRKDYCRCNVWSWHARALPNQSVFSARDNRVSIDGMTVSERMLYTALSIEPIRRENQFSRGHNSLLVCPTSGSPLRAPDLGLWIAEEAQERVWPQL
jgi:hypothetical protein